MKNFHRWLGLVVTLLVSACTAPMVGQPANGMYSELAAKQGVANAQAGVRQVPAKTLAVPTVEVSPQVQGLIAGPYNPFFGSIPQTSGEWKTLIDQRAKAAAAAIPAMKAKFNVSIEQTRIGGVNAYILTPATIGPNNRNRLLMHIHGGGYVFSPGEAGLAEAILMASMGGYKVVSVDYRMPPDHPYPAAMDDAMAVWKELIKTNDPRNMAVFGTSTGGAMVLALIHRAKAEKVALPAAIGPGTPWSDIARIGDTYETNEWVDNVLVTWDGWLGKAALLYANGRDLKDPQISPIYGDMSGFPPTILTSGTRDLFLSNTVRTHRKLRRAGVVSDLNVYEGMSHAQYIYSADAPETREAFTDISRFFDQFLGK
jgi:epsilon-lactone hydrolase